MRPDPFSRSLIALLGAVLSAAVALAEQPPNHVELREGLVIHPTAGEAYVMTPEGGIAAIDLSTGATRWTSNAAAKPVALVGNRLVSQVEPKTVAARNKLELLTLDVQKRGAPGVRSTATLPAGVRVSVGETLEGTFRENARPSDGSVIVNWSFVPAPVRGMPSEAEMTEGTAQPPSAAALARPVQQSGAVRMNLSTGAMTKVGTAAAAAAAAPQRAIPTNEIDVAKGLPQFESADGRHILVSERIADDRVWEKYRWSVYERATRRKIGETRSHVSFAPFVIHDSVLVHETTPFTRADAEDEPAKLRGISLETGKELWSVPVRETVWRGPVPP